MGKWATATMLMLLVVCAHREETRADLHGGEDYTVSYRFWIDADGLIHRFESRIQ